MRYNLEETLLLGVAATMCLTRVSLSLGFYTILGTPEWTPPILTPAGFSFGFATLQTGSSGKDLPSVGPESPKDGSPVG